MPGAGSTLQDSVRYLEKRGWLVWVADSPWILEGHRQGPAAPPHRPVTVRLEELRRAMRKAGAWVGMWNETWDTPSTAWWRVCCADRQHDIERVPVKSRCKDIRRGLKFCEVRRVDERWFLEHGYEVYRLEHRTRIQETLETFGYRRIYCSLKLAIRPWLELAVRMRAGKWAELLGADRWGPRLLSQASSLTKAHDIARSCARWADSLLPDREGVEKPRPLPTADSLVDLASKEES